MSVNPDKERDSKSSTLLVLKPDYKYSENVGNNQNRCCKPLQKCVLPLSWQTSLIVMLVLIIAAFAQMAIVVTMQVLILYYGGDGRALPEYKHCLSDDLQMAINCSENANWTNMTIPSFGKDKAVYVGFIIALPIYNAMLCFYALCRERFFDVTSFLIVNVITLLYAVFEVYQFRPFCPNCCHEWPIAGWFAITSAVVLSAFTLLFIPLTLCVYRDFGWKVYRDVNCNHEIRKYYQWYEAISSGVKLVILFTIVFCAAQLRLLLTPDNYEFELTIILLVVAIVAYHFVQLTIHYNSFTGYLVIAITGGLMILYYAFKIVRFATKSCPRCHFLTDSLNNEYKALELLLETCIDKNATLDVKSDRSIQFGNLVLFASVNLTTTIVVFVIYICFWVYFCCKPKDQLKNHFQSNPSWNVQIMCLDQRNCLDKLCCSKSQNPIPIGGVTSIPADEATGSYSS